MNDLHRPKYHFQPEANWINDPNGLVYWKGYYHLFYQYNPNGAFHGTIHWGHARSADLVHWEALPMALTPTAGGPDAGGCWSGCIVIHEGRPTLFYTAVQPQTQCVAFGDDDLIQWKKYEGNPVLAAPPPELKVLGGRNWEWRDPWVWQDEETGVWQMLVGVGLEGQGGAALLYQSEDLLNWEYRQPIVTDAVLHLGEVWECPSLFSLGAAQVFLVSPTPESRHTYYATGWYEDEQFIPAVKGKTDYGPYFYAGLTLEDGAGRRLLWGWIKEGRSDAAQRAAGWSGVMSLPRVLGLAPNGRLTMTPAPELETLRKLLGHWTNLNLNGDLPLECVGRQLEISVEAEVGDARLLGIRVLCAQDKSEGVWIEYDGVGRVLRVRRRYGETRPELDDEDCEAPLALGAGETLRLRVFVDGSVIEVFAGDMVCVTTRFYATRAESVGVGVFAEGGAVQTQSLTVWSL